MPQPRTKAEIEADYHQAQAWRARWIRLANDRDRMRRMGGLQSQQDYVLERAQRANRKVAALMREFDVMTKQPAPEPQIAHDSLEAEVTAWRARFPQYKYRPQDSCVALK